MLGVSQFSHESHCGRLSRGDTNEGNIFAGLLGRWPGAQNWLGQNNVNTVRVGRRVRRETRQKAEVLSAITGFLRQFASRRRDPIALSAASTTPPGSSRLGPP
jgi:hypothetical protein